MSRRRDKICLAFGICFILISIGLYIASPYIFTAIVIAVSHISLDSMVYSPWQSSMVPPTMTFYVYDLRNVKEVVQDGAKPFFIQRGPYTYREIRPKLNVTFNPNRTVTYDQPKTFVYLNSPTDDQDVLVTNLNMPVVVLASKFAHLPVWGAFLADGVLEVLDGGTLFVQKRATETIWGWRDPILDFIVKRVEKWFHVNLDGKELVGYYINHNATSEGIWNVWDGSDDYRKTNSIYSWKTDTSIDYWSTPYANMLNGTDGLSFKPNVQTDDTLYLFHFDLCRSTRFVYSRQVSSYGIGLYRFVMPDDMVADPRVYPDNGGFCPKGGPCMKAGVWNITACMKGLPIVLSLPHFFLADSTYSDAVDGLHPDRDLHASFLDIEPISGYTLNGHVRAQINVAIGPVAGLPETNKVKPMLFPGLWVDHAGEMDDTAASFMAKTFVLPETLLTAVLPFVLLIIGLLPFVIATCRLLFSPSDVRESNEVRPTVNANETDVSDCSSVSEDEERRFLVNSQSQPSSV